MAKEKLEECLRIRQNDGPSKALIEFLFESNFESPQGWLGYRVLNEK